MRLARRADGRQRIVFVVSAPMTVGVFLRPHIEALGDRYEVYVIWNHPNEQGHLDALAGVRTIHVDIRRNPNPVPDLWAVLRLFWMLVRIRPVAVQTVTPKAGLLGMLASLGAGVPHRVHWVTGQVWAGASGARRRFLRGLDRVTMVCSTNLLVDGPSQLEFLVREGMVDRRKATVIRHGSIAGVDTSRFRPDPIVRDTMRKELGISPFAPVVCFVGRIKRDKGFFDLVEAVRLLRRDLPVVLLAVGEDEDQLIPGERTRLGEGLCYVGQVAAVEKFLACSDVFALPSYREGFGLSVIEASAMELPVVVSDVYGLADSLVTGVTGLSVPPRDPRSLAETLRALLLDPEISREYGVAGRRRVEREFRQDQVVATYVAYISDLIDANDKR